MTQTSALPAAPPVLTISPSLTMRPAAASDEALLYEIFASSRDQSLEGIAAHPDARQKLIEHEFNSRQRGYRVDFPDVEYLMNT
jgi:hypothetical protein